MGKNKKVKAELTNVGEEDQKSEVQEEVIDCENVENVVVEEPMRIKSHKKRHENDRSFASALNIKSLTCLTYKEYQKMIQENPECGLVEMTERRHFAVPYHVAKGKVHDALNYITRMTIGKYRRPIGGVCFAVGEVKSAGPALVLNDQMVFHAEYFIKQIVFRPKVERKYPAVVQHVTKNFISATLLQTIQIKALVNQNMTKAIGGYSLEQGDVVLMKYKNMEIKGGLSSLYGMVDKLIMKGSGIAQSTVNTKKKFQDSDEEENGMDDVLVKEEEEPPKKKKKWEEPNIEEEEVKVVREKKKKKDKHRKSEMAELEDSILDETVSTPKEKKKKKKHPKEEVEVEELQESILDETVTTPKEKKKKKKHLKEEDEEVVEDAKPKKKKNKYRDFSDSD